MKFRKRSLSFLFPVLGTALLPTATQADVILFQDTFDRADTSDLSAALPTGQNGALLPATGVPWIEASPNGTASDASISGNRLSIQCSDVSNTMRVQPDFNFDVNGDFILSFTFDFNSASNWFGLSIGDSDGILDEGGFGGDTDDSWSLGVRNNDSDDVWTDTVGGGNGDINSNFLPSVSGPIDVSISISTEGVATGNSATITSFLYDGTEYVSVLSANGADTFTWAGDENRIQLELYGDGEVFIDDFTITGVGQAVSGVSVTPETLALKKGETGQLTATVAPSDAVIKAVAWSSSDTSIASVDENGLVTAEGKGTATITATSNDGGFTDTTTVSVTGDPVSGISLSHTHLFLRESHYLGSPLTPIFEPTSAANQNVTWTSSDNTIATVDANGLVVPVAEGETTVTVTTEDGGFQATVPVTVLSGWTQFTLHPGGRIWYVSSSEGNNDNDGATPETALETIYEASSRMSGGDWVLMKRGDTFNESITYWQNGLSRDYKTVFGAYGDLSEPRPIIDPPGTDSAMILQGGSIGAPATRPDRLEHIAFVSLNLYRTRRDPASPNFNASTVGNGGAGAFALRPGNDVLFEDIHSQFNSNFVVQSEGEGITNLVIRRCVFRYHFSQGEGRSQGLFMTNNHGVLIEECFFDHNGHFTEYGDPPTIFDHNMYIQGGTDSENTKVIVRHNISARASSHGLQLRPGGFAEGNVFLENGIAGFVSQDALDRSWGAQVMNDNVVLNGASWSMVGANAGTRAWGLQMLTDNASTPTIGELLNNVVANGPSFATMAFDVPTFLQGRLSIDNNITYNWGASPSTAGSYPNPDADLDDYAQAIGLTDAEAYYLAAANQRKGNWDEDLTWYALWSWQRANFGMDSVVWWPVSSLEVTQDTDEVSERESTLLDAIVLPEYASNPLVGWVSSDESIATVSHDGRVTGVSSGTVTITAVTSDGGLSDSVTLTILDRPDSFSALVGATVVDASEGTYTSDVFGDFIEKPEWNNWIYSSEGLGWLYTGRLTQTSHMWIYNLNLKTWFYTNLDVYPWVFPRKTNQTFWLFGLGNRWMYFAQASNGTGWLYEPISGNWNPVQ
jgi:uncharacterized protein YjdB